MSLEKIYKAYYDTKKLRMYFNEIKEITKLSNSSLQNAISKLIDKKIVIKEKEKSNTFYRLNDINVIKFEFSKLDIQRIEDLDINVKIPLKELIKTTKGNISFALIFGSASRREETKKSDIDILIVLNNFNDKRLQKLYETETINIFEEEKKRLDAISNHHFSFFFCTTKQFKISKDHIISQAKTTGFPIIGNQSYYEEKLCE